MMKSVCFRVFILTLAALSAGCGGGGDAAPPQQRTAVITFRAVSSATLINTVSIAAVLPPGVSVATDAENPTLISAQSLAIGSGAAAGADYILGRYSSAGRKVTIEFPHVNGFGGGEFARLTCSVTPGTTLTEADFTSLNTPFPSSRLSNYDSNISEFVDVTSSKNPQMTITFGY
ncbi:hypothetical protein [Geobacter sp. DSM 9736]|uniref:hypothetical protein n=1 Tax=Geobacter sp. DSM 9736 TaxID=1277350 RepID=UPI000B4FED85|nr:hypothetical protein [Geobacter sp. DSM 9736]SNB46774.1 hypothetical protein SAMN06269301_2244 [Geobacter sp. DSM 9736]